MEPHFIPSAPSFDDRAELFHAELYREIKRKLYSGRKDDPATRIELQLIRMYLMEGLHQAGNHGKNEGRLCIELIKTRTWTIFWESNGMIVYSMTIYLLILYVKEGDE